ncbi:MAG: hypothetical protein ABW104_00390 [Candidatus Thiodiazotropha sp. 6PLUC2]
MNDRLILLDWTWCLAQTLMGLGWYFLTTQLQDRRAQKVNQCVRYHEIKHNVSLKILDIITAHGAEMAFPSSTVHLPDAATLGANQPDPVERTPS